MNDREAAMRRRLWAIFLGEAREHFAALSRQLLDLENAPPGEATAALIEDAFREAHSLKGASRSVNFSALESLFQEAENIFSRLKSRDLAPNPRLIDALVDTVRLAEQLLNAQEAEQPLPPTTPMVVRLKEAASGSIAPPASPAAPPAAQLAGAIVGADLGPPSQATASFAPANIPEPTPAAPIASAAPAPVAKPLDAPSVALAKEGPAPPKEIPLETVRVSTAMLDAVRVRSEEFLADKLAIVERAAETQRLSLALTDWKNRWMSAKSDLTGVGDRGRTFLEWNATFLATLVEDANRLAHSTERDSQALSGRLETLLERTRDVLMLRCEWLLDGIRQPVRDLARDQKKDIRLEVSGEDIELDRRILTELKTPILHLLRNSIDHGIERPDERTAAGKSPTATLAVRISPARNGQVEIALGDDGRGFDTARLRRAAVKAGVIDADRAAQLPEDEAQQLAFGSGISTSATITDLSGRGLGLAIVREKVEKIGGTVRLESTPGKGTTFRLLLPLSLATFRGVVVRVDARHFVFPVSGVQRALRVTPAEIITLENHEMVSRGGQQIALLRLGTVLGLPPSAADASGIRPALVISAGASPIALSVDEIIGDYEIVAKKLGPRGAPLPCLAGAAILGNGAVALVIDLQEVARAAVQRVSAAQTTDDTPAPVKNKTILVTDDSITSRALLKSILETAGYTVETAVDGLDAFAKLREKPFDLVVTDVDMPRLHGIGLIERIRAEARFAELPIILVTSLDSREDRERGLEAGASAYLVKRNFEDSTLLDAVRRFL